MSITRNAILELQAERFRGIAVGRLEAVRQAVIAVQEHAEHVGNSFLVPCDVWECLIAVAGTLPESEEAGHAE